MRKKHGYEKHKSRAGKIWHFLAHDDSPLSFIASIILIMLLGKFILYPAIGVFMGTDYPIVAVISGSMDHEGEDLDSWWGEMGDWYLDKGVSKENFEDFYRSDGFKKGDVLFVVGRSLDELEIGDIIVYSAPHRQEPIIHRMVEINSDGTVSTKGDANPIQLNFENSVEDGQIKGKAVFLIPKVGWVKVLFIDLISKFYE